MADSVNVTADVFVETWSPGWELLSLRNEAVHEIAKEQSGVVARSLEIETILLHQDRQDIVPLQTFRLLHIVAEDILKGEGVDWWVGGGVEIVETYIGPTHEIAAPILKILERRMLDHLVGEIDIQGVFE